MVMKLVLSLAEGHILRVSENRVLSGIFGPKWEKVAGRWRTMHNEELHKGYISPNIIIVINLRIMRWARHVARMGETIFVKKPEGKRTLGRVTRRWEDNMRIYLRKIGW
jgi:hypothetical protein